MLTSDRGESKVAFLLYLLVAFLVVYVLFKVIPPYMDYYAIDDEASQEINMAAMNSDEVIKTDLYAKAQERELPIDKDDIVIKREGGGVTINIKWSKEVDFGYGIKRDFPFEVKAGTEKKPE